MNSVSIVAKILSLPHDQLQTVLSIASSRFSDRQRETMALLSADGWEQIDCKNGTTYLEDGRPVSWLHGLPFALTDDAWAARRAASLSSPATSLPPQIPPQQSAMCLSIIDGQLCGGSLSASPVCPKCALGKQGVAQIMTCEICGAQIAVMR